VYETQQSYLLFAEIQRPAFPESVLLAPLLHSRVVHKNQQVDRFALASPPIATGMLVAAQRAFVAQEHSEGRLTFIDLGSGQARTLTGFELGERVVDGSE